MCKDASSPKDVGRRYLPRADSQKPSDVAHVQFRSKRPHDDRPHHSSVSKWTSSPIHTGNLSICELFTLSSRTCDLKPRSSSGISHTLWARRSTEHTTRSFREQWALKRSSHTQNLHQWCFTRASAGTSLALRGARWSNPQTRPSHVQLQTQHLLSKGIGWSRPRL
jgi:hypothetical protein